MILEMSTNRKEYPFHNQDTQRFSKNTHKKKDPKFVCSLFVCGKF